MEGGRRSLFYHPKGTILEEFLFITRQGRAELLVETSLAHGGGESLGQRDDQAEHFTGWQVTTKMHFSRDRASSFTYHRMDSQM